jgi:hypothetical protein
LFLLVAACKGEDRAPKKGYAAVRGGEPAAPAATSVTPEPLVVAGHPLDGTVRPRAAAGAITGEDDRARSAFALTAPGQGWSFAWDDLSVLAVPDRSWMARRCDGREVDPKAGDLTAALVAAAAGPFVDHDRCVPVLPPGEDFPRPLAALGAGDERAIILVRETMDPSNQTLYDVAASTDAGKTWTLKPGPPDIRSHSVADVYADRVGGHVDVMLRAHREDADVMLLLQLDGAHPLDIPVPVEVERFQLEAACRAAGATWWLGEDGRVRRAERGVLAEVAGAPLFAPSDFDVARIVDCSADQALVASKVATGTTLLHCRAAGCTPAFDDATGTAALLADGRAIRVTADGNQLHLLREGSAAATTFTVPATVLLEGVVVWSDVPYALITDAPDAPPAIVKLAPR